MYVPYGLTSDESIASLCELINSNESLQYVISDSYSQADSLPMKMLETISDKLIGNVSLRYLSLNIKVGEGDKYNEIFHDLATKTGITSINMPPGSVTEEEATEIQRLLQIPLNEREIPISSTMKSAAKSNRNS